MHIQRFAVTGYRSFLEPQEIHLQPGITVVHGDNGAGKTNLLRAMKLCLDLLGGPLVLGGAGQVTVPIELPRFAHVQGDRNVSLEADIAVTSGDLRRVGFPNAASGTLSVAWHLLDPDPPAGRSCRMVRLDVPFAEELGKGARNALAQLFRQEPITYLPVTRRFLDETRSASQGLPEDQPFAKVKRRILECYLSSEHKARYRQFARVIEDAPLSLGRVEPTLDLASDAIGLALETPLGRFTLDEIASGTRQILLLVAKIMLDGSAIVVIEEPETSLSLATQERLFQALRGVTAEPDSPVRQVFLESHSERFELARDDPDATFVDVSHDGVKSTLAVRPARDRARYFGVPPDEQVTGTRLTRSGLVKLPEAVRTSLGIGPGDPVYFLKGGSGFWEVLVEKDALERMLPGGGGVG